MAFREPHAHNGARKQKPNTCKGISEIGRGHQSERTWRLPRCNTLWRQCPQTAPHQSPYTHTQCTTTPSVTDITIIMIKKTFLTQYYMKSKK